MEQWQIVVGILVLIGVVSFIWWLSELLSIKRNYIILKPKLENFEEERIEFEKQRESWIAEFERMKEYWTASFERNKVDWTNKVKRYEAEWQKKIRDDQNAIETLYNERSKGMPFLAEAYAEYFYLIDLKKAEYLAHKSHPAKKTADEIKKEIAVSRRKAEIESRTYKYQLKYYEYLFPLFEEYREDFVCDSGITNNEVDGSPDNSLDDSDQHEARRNWLSPDEYKVLSSSQKNQRALDNYLRRNKNRWEIGRDYERFIGYLWEKDGYQVEYQGILKGKDDLGRDIIATKGTRVEIIQCKKWSRNKVIHEKHIFQLYGTLIAYKIDHGQTNELFPNELEVKGVFITSTVLSDRAKIFAKELDIEIVENYDLKPYPCIKCNISQIGGEKIFHLPFDQQYDTTKIEPQKGEFYAWTVQEAEEKEFRRAFRWKGEN